MGMVATSAHVHGSRMSAMMPSTAKSSQKIFLSMSDFQVDNRRPGAALVLRRLGDGSNVGMAFQKLPQRLAENAHTRAVHDTDAWQAGKERPIDKLVDTAGGVVDVFPDHIDLARCGDGFVGDRHRNAARAGSLERRRTLRLAATRDHL